MDNFINDFLIRSMKKRIRTMRVARFAVGLCAGVFLVGFAFVFVKQESFTLAGLLLLVGTLTGFLACFTLAEHIKLLILDGKEALAILNSGMAEKVLGELINMLEKK